MAKTRKLSDHVRRSDLTGLTTQDTGAFLQMIENFKHSLSDDDEDEKSVIAS